MISDNESCRKSLPLRLYGEISRSEGICPEQQWQHESPNGGQTLLVVLAEDSSETDEADEAGKSVKLVDLWDNKRQETIVCIQTAAI